MDKELIALHRKGFHCQTTVHPFPRLCPKAGKVPRVAKVLCYQLPRFLHQDSWRYRETTIQTAQQLHTDDHVVLAQLPHRPQTLAPLDTGLQEFVWVHGRSAARPLEAPC